MRNVLGSWLSGPRSVAARDVERPRWRGERFGLPESGAGAAAPIGRRAAGFLIDIALAAGVALLFTAPNPPMNWSILAWVLITVLPVSLFGVTPGMTVVGIWVVRLDGHAMVGVPRAVLRCILTFVLVPAVLWDLDGRAWHDRLSGTVVIRRRG